MLNLTRRRTYPSDLTDAQWLSIEPLVTPLEEKRVGRKRETNLREVLNAINYRWMSGCVWRMLPHDLPAWNTVYMYAHRWEEAGLLSKIRTLLITSPARLPIVKQEILRALESESNHGNTDSSLLNLERDTFPEQDDETLEALDSYSSQVG
ncbi:MAG: transposase [Planctomycetaceae bacterium]